MRTLVLPHSEAKHAPVKKNGLTRRGWIWRPHSGMMKWTFTSSIDNASRGYPSGAEFVPVYAEEMQ